MISLIVSVDLDSMIDSHSVSHAGATKAKFEIRKSVKFNHTSTKITNNNVQLQYRVSMKCESIFLRDSMKKNLSRIKIDFNNFNCRFVSRIKQNQLNQRKMMNNKDFLVGCYSRAENIKETEKWNGFTNS